MVGEEGNPFCGGCRASSSAPGAPSLATNQGIGRMFHGRAKRCEACGSSVRTLWWVFLLLPVVPLGSFRVIEFEEEAEDGASSTLFLSRRVPLRWTQVLLGWAATAAVLAFLLWILASRAR